MTKYDLYPHDFWLKVDQRMNHPSSTGLRYGQVVFNLLNRYKPDHARFITGTDLDPFYDDSRLPALRLWLARNWLAEFE